MATIKYELVIQCNFKMAFLKNTYDKKACLKKAHDENDANNEMASIKNELVMWRNFKMAPLKKHPLKKAFNKKAS